MHLSVLLNLLIEPYCRPNTLMKTEEIFMNTKGSPRDFYEKIGFPAKVYEISRSEAPLDKNSRRPVKIGLRKAQISSLRLSYPIAKEEQKADQSLKIDLKFPFSQKTTSYRKKTKIKNAMIPPPP